MFGIGHMLRLGIVLGRTLLVDSVSSCHLVLVVCGSESRRKNFYHTAATPHSTYLRAYLAEKAMMPLYMRPC